MNLEDDYSYLANHYGVKLGQKFYIKSKWGIHIHYFLEDGLYDETGQRLPPFVTSSILYRIEKRDLELYYKHPDTVKHSLRRV